MYKIRIDSFISQNLTNDYLVKYTTSIRNVIKKFLRGDSDCIFKYKVGTKKQMTFTLKVDTRNSSFTSKFLARCVNTKDGLLENLLIGNVQAQLKIIQYVLNDSHSHFERLSVKKARAMGYQDGQTIDDFNAILHKIFINQCFDGDLKKSTAALDKDDFVKRLGIRLCPYCGRAYIYRVEKKGKAGMVAVKPQLDHFLPKQSYPFLGMNFFNMIPSCTQCNMAPCKVDNDPLDSSKGQIKYLMHPYSFDEKMIRFLYKLSSPNTYDPSSYDVLVGYKNKDLKKGYNDFLAIDKLYAGHRDELNNMFIRARSYHVLTNDLYKEIGIKRASIPINLAVLGFNLINTEETRQLMYKFYKDTFLQMISRFSLGKTESFYVDMFGSEKCVTI